MRLSEFGTITSLFLAAALPAWGSQTIANPAVPGTLNYVEGQASIGTQTLTSKSIGSTELDAGQSLTTENGRAEVLLTPGVFLRIGSDSTVRMISPYLTDTEVDLEKGHAIIEVAEIHPENDIRIAAGDTVTTLLKTGLYDVDLNHDQLRVFDGKAFVQEGGDEHATIKGGREISLAGNAAEKLKASKFKKKKYEESGLYRWSSLRSSYLAEANVDAAGQYAANGWGPWGPGWWGADWYWDPYFDAFTSIPGDGIFYSPFGWGFYSPWLVNEAPFFGFGAVGSGVRPFYRHFGTDYRNWGSGPHYVTNPNYAHGIYRGPGSIGGFHSGSILMTGSRSGFGRIGDGGFRGGGLSAGGFHGGAFHGGDFQSNLGFHGGGGFHSR